MSLDAGVFSLRFPVVEHHAHVRDRAGEPADDLGGLVQRMRCRMLAGS